MKLSNCRVSRPAVLNTVTSRGEQKRVLKWGAVIDERRIVVLEDGKPILVNGRQVYQDQATFANMSMFENAGEVFSGVCELLKNGFEFDCAGNISASGYEDKSSKEIKASLEFYVTDIMEPTTANTKSLLSVPGPKAQASKPESGLDALKKLSNGKAKPQAKPAEDDYS